TGDHGVLPTPEVLAALGLPGTRTDDAGAATAINSALSKLAKKGQPALSVVRIEAPLVYLSHPPGAVDRLAAQRAAAAALSAQPDILEAFAPADLGQMLEPFRTFYLRLSHPGRTPDVLIRARPYDLIETEPEHRPGHGTEHGSPYTYDTNV